MLLDFRIKSMHDEWIGGYIALRFHIDSGLRVVVALICMCMFCAHCICVVIFIYK